MNQKSTLIYYEDLEAEAILEIEVENFPVIVVSDKDRKRALKSRLIF